MLKLLTATSAVTLVSGLDNGLGRTPAMGYNSWYDVECTAAMNESVIRDVTDAMVAKGFLALGYDYINLDDCWAGGRDATGKVLVDTDKFPSGMKSLADYAHSKGFKFGVYSDRGTETCAGRPGALNHTTIDAQTYADWGVDYLKEDSCHASGDHATAFAEYGEMRDALNKTGRPIYFSLCGWNSWYAPVGQSLGNSWRIGPDDGSWGNVLKNVNIMATVAQYAGPGGWNDPCLLTSTSNTGAQLMTLQQSQMQFSVWAITASPLLISGSVLHMSDDLLKTYSNKDVIAIDQDPLGSAGARINGTDLPEGNTNVWGRVLANGDFALVFINVAATPMSATCTKDCFAKMNVTDQAGRTCKNLWTGESSQVPADGTLSAQLASGAGYFMVRCSK